MMCTDEDGHRGYCRKNAYGYMTCSDNDRFDDYGDWDAEAAATQQFGWWNQKTKANCRKDAWGYYTCTDNDGGDRRRCKKINGRMICTDEDGHKGYCRKNAYGYMTCSDNDRFDDYGDWDEEAATQQFGWWSKKTKVNCRKDAFGYYTCTDNDGSKRRCYKRANGRLDCTDDDGRKRICNMQNGYMSCSDNDRWDWDVEADATFEEFLAEQSAEFMI